MEMSRNLSFLLIKNYNFLLKINNFSKQIFLPSSFPKRVYCKYVYKEKIMFSQKR